MLVVTGHPRISVPPVRTRSTSAIGETTSGETRARFLSTRPAGNICPGGCPACAVRGLTFCDSLSDDELRELNAIVTDVRYRDNDILFDEGTYDGSVHIITHGFVRMHKTLSDGRRLVVNFAMPGDFLGLQPGEKRAFTADAIGEVRACMMSRAAFSELLSTKPHLTRWMQAEMAHELTLSYDRMVLLGRCSAREKLATFLVCLLERWKRLSGPSFNVALPMTRRDIADFLGLTIETVCRTLSTMAQEKILVIVPGGVRVLNLPRLEAIAAE